MLVFVIAVLRFANVRQFRKPSCDRFPLNWSGDPRQAIFIASLSSFGAFLGSVLGRAVSGAMVVNVIALNGSICLGLVIGQRLGYLLWRERFD
jgi:hypothetical protein